EAVAERIGYSYEYNRNSTCLVHHGGNRGGANDQDRVGLECNQFSRRCSHAVDFASRPAIRDPNVATRPSELLESLPERSDLRLCLRIAFGRPHQHPDAPHGVGLRTRHARRRGRRAAAQSDELAPRHSITSWAGARAMWPAIGSYPTALCANAG